ncbi:efflux RND transporter permease subunit [Stieleria sp. ICT_E10.1]|uniref:Cation efflux system protein CusA n=1 Tax=Stieleria magnilauensis TaxID=2527963 RepID=A0ABX5XWN5_9BACT|nr:efflux RND transporter permease subunit [Stieleria sedimenti]MCS7466310.1 efflux RND transporter permease subunit [Stieleria sedimenti]QDV85360.1 Cation efflux system protein CusA [Planctomycetes bacterium TBK1r]
MFDPSDLPDDIKQARKSFLGSVIWFCLHNKLVILLVVLATLTWGAMVAPFDWDLRGLPRDPVPVDAIPDIGENQQIVFTEWMGRSPQDVEDQIGYPLTVALLGIPEVKTIRSYSLFGFSSIFIIFNDDAEFYWSRSRVLEKLNSLPAGTLPEGVQPALGPDATALGQVYLYTLEGHDPDGVPTGGWDLDELRTIQDWYVRYSLTSAEGISEVASIGGFVREYQIDVDPDAMRAAGVSLADVFQSVKMTNVDVGARTIELNKAEYVIRGLGFIEQIDDIEKTVLRVADNVPITIKDVATVSLGPALRRGALDKAGAEAVGGVCVVRFGYNPLEAIKNIKGRVTEISPGLPSKVIIDYLMTTQDQVDAYAVANDLNPITKPGASHDQWVKHLRSQPREQWPAWITTSQVTVVPFYDRTGVIYETLGTLNTALTEEILVTIIVILVMVLHMRSSILISALLPLAVLMCFIAMKAFGVDANIVALSGIAIAIGTMVDMGIILCENILKQLDEAGPDDDTGHVIFRAAHEVASAVLTAVSTTVVSFLPVFTMIAAEGKLFRPLAFTKTFALAASVIVALTIIPPAAHILFGGRIKSETLRRAAMIALIIAGIVAMFVVTWWVGAIVIGLGAYKLIEERIPKKYQRFGPYAASAIAVLVVGFLLTDHWLPLGPEKGLFRNLMFVGGLIGGLLGFFTIFQRFIYEPLLRWCLAHKLLFLSLPALILLFGASAWQGFDRIFGFVPKVTSFVGVSELTVRQSSPWSALSAALPGLGKEFMPPLDEGSYLYMPTTMPHASIGEAMDVLQLQNKFLVSIPEVESVVGKIGRAESPLDPAPISMIETYITYKSEYKTDKDGHRLKFQFDEKSGGFVRDKFGELVEDENGRPFRQWRDEIKTPNDIWEKITEAADIPGTTSAPKLQPIAARIVMLQSGMRAPMGMKVKGPDLETIEKVALQIEGLLKQVPTVQASAVIADRIVGKPYLEIDIDRDAIKRYGLHIRSVQDVIEVAIGGRRITTTVEGRERYPVRVRYARELRDEAESLGRILVPTPMGSQIPLEQLAEIRYVRGPQVIKSEDTFLLGYVLFDMKSGNAEVDVVEDAQAFLQEKIDSGELILPAGVSYTFAGNYENQLRSQKTLMVVLPLALGIIFLILYMQFKSVITTSLVFSGIMIAWSGGFIMLWLYGTEWFLNFDLFGTDMRTLFQVHTINLSVAVWVGFLALFGIASDDGVVIASYLDESFRKDRITNIEHAREATVTAGVRRVRPCLMTTATTLLALIPVLTSTGRGSDIMVPMAIPSFGGMTIEIMTMLVVPVLYCSAMEWKLRLGIKDERFAKDA